MQTLLKEVRKLSMDEYGRACQKFGCIHTSDHQAAAVLFEEFEETTQEIGHMSTNLRQFWECVKADKSDEEKTEALTSIRNDALLAACEAIQVAAMAYKAQLTINTRGEIKV